MQTGCCLPEWGENSHWDITSEWEAVTHRGKKKESRSSSYHILSRKIYITKRLDIYPPYTTQWWYFLFLFFMWLLRVNRSLNRRPILLLFLFFSLSSIQLSRTGCTQPRERESSVKSSLGYLYTPRGVERVHIITKRRKKNKKNFFQFFFYFLRRRRCPTKVILIFFSPSLPPPPYNILLCFCFCLHIICRLADGRELHDGHITTRCVLESTYSMYKYIPA